MAKSITVLHTNYKIGHYKTIPLETLHNRLGHTRANTIIFTSQNRFWSDLITTMNAERFCEPCQIVTTRARNHCKIPPSNPLERGHTIYMDILPPIPGLSSSTTFKFLLWLVDRTSHYAFITGLHDCTTESVIDGINRFTAPTSHPVVIEFDIHRIKPESLC